MVYLTLFILAFISLALAVVCWILIRSINEANDRVYMYSRIKGEAETAREKLAQENLCLMEQLYHATKVIRMAYNE